MTDLSTSVDGKTYTDERFLNKRRKRQCAIDTAIANPTWSIREVQAAVQQAHGAYTEVAVRMALKDAGIARKQPRPKGMKYDTSGEKKRPKAIPAAPIRASVHSYSGRSRLSAGYTEL